MDRRVKERLVGAVVLVVLGVVIIPWLLDGQGSVDIEGSPSAAVLQLPVPDEPVSAAAQGPRTRTIEIEIGQSAAPAYVHSAPADGEPAEERQVAEPATEPQLAAEADARLADSIEADSRLDGTAASRAPQASPESTSSSADARPTSETVATAASAASGWMVQLGSFGDESNAVRQADRVKTYGYEPQISSYSASGRRMYRVRVGPVESRERAEVARSALSAHGFVAQIVAPD